MRAVLFDLDGTLLDIDIDAFLSIYFGALGPVLAELTDLGPAESIGAVTESTRAMMRSHPGRTNREAFNSRFLELTGVDLGAARHTIDSFYSDVFPGLGEGFGPKTGARRAVDAARQADLVVAVATNPIFPARAISERIRWAGLSDVPFALVTSYENMHACKPQPAYFDEVATLLSVAPSECLMVGDDPTLDMAASSIGMSTFFVGGAGGDGADYAGNLDDLAAMLAELHASPAD